MEVMIDIETLDTKESAVVYQVGAVFFKGNKIIEKFFWNIRVKEQLIHGRTLSSDTMLFHLKGDHNQDFLEALSSFGRVSANCFAAELIIYIDRYKPTRFWAKGNFDFPILENLLDYCCTLIPWKFYQLRELRTLMKECNVDKGKVQHDALQDCLDQIKRLKACRKVIKRGTA